MIPTHRLIQNHLTTQNRPMLNRRRIRIPIPAWIRCRDRYRSIQKISPRRAFWRIRR
jgi:hypothetical protein